MMASGSAAAGGLSVGLPSASLLRHQSASGPNYDRCFMHPPQHHAQSIPPPPPPSCPPNICFADVQLQQSTTFAQQFLAEYYSRLSSCVPAAVTMYNPEGRRAWRSCRRPQSGEGDDMAVGRDAIAQQIESSGICSVLWRVSDFDVSLIADPPLISVGVVLTAPQEGVQLTQRFFIARSFEKKQYSGFSFWDSAILSEVLVANSAFKTEELLSKLYPYAAPPAGVKYFDELATATAPTASQQALDLVLPQVFDAAADEEESSGALSDDVLLPPLHPMVAKDFDKWSAVKKGMEEWPEVKRDSPAVREVVEDEWLQQQVTPRQFDECDDEAATVESLRRAAKALVINAPSFPQNMKLNLSTCRPSGESSSHTESPLSAPGDVTRPVTPRPLTGGRTSLLGIVAQSQDALSSAMTPRDAYTAGLSPLTYRGGYSYEVEGESSQKQSICELPDINGGFEVPLKKEEENVGDSTLYSEVVDSCCWSSELPGDLAWGSGAPKMAANDDDRLLSASSGYWCRTRVHSLAEDDEENSVTRSNSERCSAQRTNGEVVGLDEHIIAGSGDGEQRDDAAASDEFGDLAKLFFADLSSKAAAAEAGSASAEFLFSGTAEDELDSTNGRSASEQGQADNLFEMFCAYLLENANDDAPLLEESSPVVGSYATNTATAFNPEPPAELLSSAVEDCLDSTGDSDGVANSTAAEVASKVAKLLAAEEDTSAVVREILRARSGTPTPIGSHVPSRLQSFSSPIDRSPIVSTDQHCVDYSSFSSANSLQVVNLNHFGTSPSTPVVKTSSMSHGFHSNVDVTDDMTGQLLSPSTDDALDFYSARQHTLHHHQQHMTAASASKQLFLPTATAKSFTSLTNTDGLTPTTPDAHHHDKHLFRGDFGLYQHHHHDHLKSSHMAHLHRPAPPPLPTLDASPHGGTSLSLSRATSPKGYSPSCPTSRSATPTPPSAMRGVWNASGGGLLSAGTPANGGASSSNPSLLNFNRGKPGGGGGPTFWGMWEDERDRMVYVSWLPRVARATDRHDKKKCELQIKEFIGTKLGFLCLDKVLLFPPSSAHCKLIFNKERYAQLFLDAYGGVEGTRGPEDWKHVVCEEYDVDIKDGIEATKVKIIWADQTKNVRDPPPPQRPQQHQRSSSSLGSSVSSSTPRPSSAEKRRAYGSSVAAHQRSFAGAQQQTKTSTSVHASTCGNKYGRSSVREGGGYGVQQTPRESKKVSQSYTDMLAYQNSPAGKWPTASSSSAAAYTPRGAGQSNRHHTDLLAEIRGPMDCLTPPASGGSSDVYTHASLSYAQQAVAYHQVHQQHSQLQRGSQVLVASPGRQQMTPTTTAAAWSGFLTMPRHHNVATAVAAAHHPATYAYPLQQPHVSQQFYLVAAHPSRM